MQDAVALGCPGTISFVEYVNMADSNGVWGRLESRKNARNFRTSHSLHVSCPLTCKTQTVRKTCRPINSEVVVYDMLISAPDDADRRVRVYEPKLALTTLRWQCNELSKLGLAVPHLIFFSWMSDFFYNQIRQECKLCTFAHVTAVSEYLR